MKQLKEKITDYQRFIMVLVICSIYLYLGALDHLYIHPSNDGKLLLLLSFGLIIGSMALLKRYNQMKNELER